MVWAIGIGVLIVLALLLLLALRRAEAELRELERDPLGRWPRRGRWSG